MIETIAYFLFAWGATIIWITLCFFGIYYGFREIRESCQDMDAVNQESESIRYEVALSNVKSSKKNILVQVLFLFFAMIIIYLRLEFPGEYPVTLARSIISPILLVIAEGILVSQLRDLTKIRNKVRGIVIDHLKKQGKTEKDIL